MYSLVCTFSGGFGLSYCFDGVGGGAGPFFLVDSFDTELAGPVVSNRNDSVSSLWFHHVAVDSVSSGLVTLVFRNIAGDSRTYSISIPSSGT